MDNKGYIKNCFIMGNGSDNPIFGQRHDGSVIPLLDGFAIIPMKEYERLKALEPKEK